LFLQVKHFSFKNASTTVKEGKSGSNTKSSEGETERKQEQSPRCSLPFYIYHANVFVRTANFDGFE